jgi:hypothetical protein
MPQFENPTRKDVLYWMIALILAFIADGFLCLFEENFSSERTLR